MTYQLRERPDGQVEIIVNRPSVLGVMADADMAERFVAFLKLEEPELTEDEPASFGKAAADVADAEDLDLEEDTAAAPFTTARVAQVPAPVERPSPPAVLPATVPPEVTESDIEVAFRRIAAGERLSDVARDVGMLVYSLRARWAAHCRHLQRHLADGGQEDCSLCQKPFTPSITSPDKCARCAKGV